MPLDDCLNNSEPKTETALLALPGLGQAAKWLKRRIDLIGRDARPGIRNRNIQRLGLPAGTLLETSLRVALTVT